MHEYYLPVAATPRVCPPLPQGPGAAAGQRLQPVPDQQGEEEPLLPRPPGPCRHSRGPGRRIGWLADWLLGWLPDLLLGCLPN